MRPVSSEFLTTVKGSHTMSARARVCSTFQTGTDPDGTTIPILTGEVTIDGTAEIRSTIDMTTDGTGMWPRRADDLLAPYGNELFIERGVQYSAGTIEWCSLGFFRIETPEQGSPPDGPIRLSGKDRMAGIIDARLLAPAQYMDTDTYGTVMTALITEVYPDATIEWDDATDADTLGRSLIVEQDRYKFLADLVTSRGKIWYWDHRGILVIKDLPAATDPVFEVHAGAGGVLVSMSRQLTRDGVYNAVVATGEATDSEHPVRGVAIDDNPSSPTYFHGRFGPVPRYFSSAFLTSDGEAAGAATGLLQQSLGLPYNVDFVNVPNPALEPYDPVSIRASAADSTEIHVIDSLHVPLTADGTQSASTREQTTVLIGVM